MNREIMRALFPDEMDRVDREQCPFCGAIPEGFRDEVSAREYEISGLCQTCQDKVFEE